MAKGLVGGVNSATSGSSVPSVTATAGGESTYTAKINNVGSTPVEYTGRETDSMCIDVDNTTRTISGEVKWRSMLAATEQEEDAYHAYPANKARLNFEEINKSLVTLKRDVDSLEASCDNSVSTILTYTERLQEIEAELNDCLRSCTQLRNSLEDEKFNRESDHLALRTTAQNNFNSLTDRMDGLSSLTTERLDAQQNNIQQTRNDLQLERDRAQLAESTLSDSLKKTNRIVSKNEQGLASLRQDTADIVGRLQYLESVEIENQLVDHSAVLEHLTQQVGDTDFRLTLEYETTARETAQLRDIQYKHESLITNLTAGWKEAEQDVEDLQRTSSKLSTSVSQILKDTKQSYDDNVEEHALIRSSVQTEAEIRRESDKYHEAELSRLEVRISTLQNDLTQVIQALANELRGKDLELQASLKNMSYDFIDAGNAPI